MARIAVLGCGPAGLAVAQAVRLNGHKVEIVSNPTRSKIGGAQYLHQPITGINDPSLCDGRITFIKWGRARGYALKVYGDEEAPTSWGKFDGSYRVWNLQKTYDMLWDQLEPHLSALRVGPDELKVLVECYDYVFSTIPLRSLCPEPDEYEWRSQTVYITMHQDNPLGLPPNTIVYSGEPSDPWYRTSHIFGQCSSEYSMVISRVGREVEDFVRVVKPLSTTFKLEPPIYTFGRYGRWEKDQLVSDAFRDAMQVSASLR